MDLLHFSRDYTFHPKRSCTFPSIFFYMNLVRIFYKAGNVAKKGHYSGQRWAEDSIAVGNLIENTGIPICIEGTEVLDKEGPFIFEANHMSTLETLFLPCIIQPRKDVTFVVKASLLKYPALGRVLAARDPLALGRINPRADLALVMDEGKKVLESGRSIIIFTQGSRKTTVEEGDFNTLAVKLARKAGVPVVPIALKTDAWSEGSIIKDIGWIKPERTVHVRFGEPVEIHTTGREEHARIVQFIKNSYEEWAAEDGSK